MPIESRFSVPVPNCSIQSWILSQSSSGPLSNRKAWIDADNPQSRYLTYSSAQLLAKRIAVGLISHGVQPGDRVLVFSGNTIVFPAIMLGIWMAGGIFTGANPGYVPRELAYQLKDSGARIMIAAEQSWDTALRAAALAALGEENVFALDDSVPGLSDEKDWRFEEPQHWSRLVGSKKKGEAFVWEEPEDPATTTCTLNYSSGTTGLPKGVELTHRNHVANSTGIIHFDTLHPSYPQRLSRASTLCFIPMYHAFAQGYFISAYPRRGIPVYVMPSFDLAKMLRHISEFKITKLFLVPPICVLMSKHPLARQADLTSLDMVGCGAAALARETQAAVNDLLPRNKCLPKGQDELLRQGFGMTELTCTAMGWDATRPGSEGIGELMPDCKAKVINTETDEEITEPNTPGELYITGPNLMRGYWRNSKATLATITHDEDDTRWIRTGDIAYFSPTYSSGAIFHIVDRKKELIKVKGFQVSPTELDSLLLGHEDVLDAATVGVTIDGEEVPRAYAVLKNGSEASEKDLERWVGERVVKYKRLEGGVVLVDAIPKNPSGKILRNVLKERARRELEEGVRARL